MFDCLSPNPEWCILLSMKKLYGGKEEIHFRSVANIPKRV